MSHQQATHKIRAGQSILNSDRSRLQHRSTSPMAYGKAQQTTATTSSTFRSTVPAAAVNRLANDRLLRAFGMLDHDGDGFVDAHDLRKVYTQTFADKDDMSFDEAKFGALIALASSDTQSSLPLVTRQAISFEQFVRLVDLHNIAIPPQTGDAVESQKSLEKLLSDLMNLRPLHASVSKRSLVAEREEVASQRSYWNYWKSMLTSAAVKHLIAGGIAGAVSRTVVSPLERMKILFQVQSPGSTVYQGVLPTLAKMWREEGIVGFLRGNGTNVIRIVPYSAVQFAAYEKYKRLLLEEGKNELDATRRLTAGAAAGITSVTCTYPLDIVRTRLSVQSASIGGVTVRKKLPGILATMASIYRSEGGIIALYRGLGPTLMGVAPYVALNFHSYEVLRKYFTPPNETSPSVFQKLMCGALAGTFAQTMTYPLDVLRRRMQVTGLDKLGLNYTGTWDAANKMFKAEGVRGFYKGMVPNYLKVAPAIGVSFVVYEACKEILRVA